MKKSTLNVNLDFLKKSLLLFSVLSGTGSLALAQQGNIKGRISGMEAGDVPVVNLLLAKDSSIAKATFCDTNGIFEFDALKDGLYLAAVNHLGYLGYTSNPIDISAAQQQVTLPDIILQAAATAIKEVEIVARKPFVQQKIDRVVVNPDALIGNAGATAMEVLEKSPGIMVDQNGNISLKGRPGVMVFIDNKPTYMATTELADYLRSLPASSIESIELMTNPPAGYDAAGNAGIVNIKLKRNANKGFNGSINLSYGQGKYLRTNNSLNFNYRINKLNLFSTISVGENNSYQDLTINRYYFRPDGTSSSTFTQNSYIKRRSGSSNARIGADYYLSEKSTLGAVFSGFINPTRSSNDNHARILDGDNALSSRIAAYSNSDRKLRNGGVNLNYAYKVDDKGKELSVNADYIAYTSTHEQSLKNSTYTPGNVLENESLLNSTLPATLSIASAKIDYAHPFSDKSKLDAGLKSSIVNTDNTASFFDIVNGSALPNYEFSNRFKYKENINAGYINYAKDWKQFSVQLGLRLEQTHIDGHQLGNIQTKDSSFTRDYTSLFPTLFIAYRADTVQRHQFGFSFGRRIERPDYQDLNPFTYPMDRYTYYGGNPFLQPTFSYNFALTHTYKNFLTTSLEYSIADNLINETNEQRANIYYSRPGNFGRQTVYGLSVNGNFTLTKWWTLIVYSEFKNVAIQSEIYGQQLDEQKWYWYVGPTNQFTITKNLSAELAGSYQTRILSGQFLTIPVWQMRAGLAQKVLKGNGTVRLNLSDIFYTNQPGGDIRNIANSRADWLSYLDSRVATISFAYRFNKGKTLNARESGASDTEKGRVR